MEEFLLKSPLKKYLLGVAVALSALPLAGLACNDAPYFRYAFSRLLPGLGESAAIETAVTDFNNRLMDIYASQGNKRAVETVPATVGMRHRLFKDAGFLWMGGRVLVYDIASLEIKSVTMNGPVSATVLASEEWNYQYKNDSSWKSIAEVRGTGSLFRYQLVRQGGRWLVQKYEPVREVKKGV